MGLPAVACAIRARRRRAQPDQIVNRPQPSEIVQTGGSAARAMMRAPAMAYNAVRGVVSPLVPRWAIIVNGKPLVAVPDRNMARR